MPFYKADRNGGYYIVSGKSQRAGKSIGTLLEGCVFTYYDVMSANGEAACAMAELSSIRLDVGRNEVSETAVNECLLRLKAAWNKLLEAFSDGDTSFYHLLAIPDG